MSKHQIKQTNQKQPKIALVHDYLREYGGAERVLEALHVMYPDAPVYTAFVDEKAMGSHWHRFAEWDIRQSWMSRIPGIKRLYSPLRLFAAKAFSDFDLSQYDIIISSTNAYMAKAVKVTNGTHICYCHTPPRSLYGYSTMSDWKKKWWMRVPGELINHVMRIIDFKTAQDVDIFIANSKETARRIQKFYRRQSTVVFPPVQLGGGDLLAKNQAKQTKVVVVRENQSKDKYAIYVNRLAFAKHPELAVAACSKLKMPLKVVGTGPLLPELQKNAGSEVTFMGSVSDTQLHELYAGASVLLYPVEDEDFGIVPIEAMSHGVPVIAHASGGPLETIVEAETGIFFEDLSVQGLIDAIKKFEVARKGNGSFNPEKIKAHANQFSTKAFEQKIQNIVKGSYGR